MGGEIEGDAQALLTGSEVAAVECVRFLRGRKTSILANGPRAARIHRRAHAACERRETGQARVASVLRGVQRLHSNALGRVPGQILALDLLVGCFFPVVYICHQIIRYYFAVFAPSRPSREPSKSKFHAKPAKERRTRRLLPLKLCLALLQKGNAAFPRVRAFARNFLRLCLTRQRVGIIHFERGRDILAHQAQR